jgi:uncharacterized DUF497 family protein
MIFDWDNKKNELLIKTRGVSFEEVLSVLEDGDVLDIIDHPNKEKYAHQQMYVVEIGGYVYLVPFVKDKSKIFLKTIIPNRKAQKKYLGK